MAAPVWNTNDVPTATDFNVWLTNILYATKTSTESVTSSTALQDDDHLFLPLATNSVYWVWGILSTDGASGGDLKVAIASLTGMSILLHWDGLTSTAATGADDVLYLMEATGTPATFGTIAAADHRPLSFRGTATTTSTAGNFQLRWAQDTSSGTATRILAGSTIWAQRIS